MKTIISTLFMIFAICGFGMTATAGELKGYNSKNFISVEAMHRSGNPDVESNVETFHNEISFTPIEGVTSYDVNRDGATVAKIEFSDNIYTLKEIDAEGNFASVGTLAPKNGVLTMVDIVEGEPVNPGEGIAEFGAIGFEVYTVSFEAEGDSYECDEQFALYEGSSWELVIAAKIRGYGYNEDGCGVSISWDKAIETEEVKNAVAYEVYRNAGEGWEKVATTTNTYFNDAYSEMEPTRLQYYIKAIFDGCEKNSQVVSVAYGGRSGVEEVLASSEENLKIKAYPNPTTDFITVEGACGNLTIYSLNGAALTSVKVAEGEVATLDMTSLTSGMYLLKTENQSAVKVLKK